MCAFISHLLHVVHEIMKLPDSLENTESLDSILIGMFRLLKLSKIVLRVFTSPHLSWCQLFTRVYGMLFSITDSHNLSASR